MVKLATAESIRKQGGDTAAYWLNQAVEYIDKEFGDGYSKKHPELVGQFIQASALDQAGMYVRTLVERLNEMDFSVKIPTDNVADSLSEIASEIGNIADKINSK